MKKIITTNIISVIFALIGGVSLGLCLEEYTLKKSLPLPELIIGCIFVFIAIVIKIVMYSINIKNLPKNRKIVEVEYDIPKKSELDQTIKLILKNNGYTLISYNNENVYKNGSGFWTTRKFINYYFDNNKLIIEGWVSNGIGNKPNIEFPIDEKFLLKFPKRQVQKVINNIISLAKIN